jgi:hypothetical protein
MSTPQQIEANRLNAQKSTGPSSVEGKAASRFNALKHAADAQSRVIPGEDPAVLEELSRDYYRQFRPVGPIETALVETIIEADWTIRRMTRAETEHLNAVMAAMEPTPYALGLAFQQDAANGHALQKIFRRQQAARRDWHRAIQELRALQAERPPLADPDPVEPATRPAAQAPANQPVSVGATAPPPVPPRPASAPSNTGNRVRSESLALRL